MRSALRLDAASEMDPHSPFAELARARDAALRETPGEARQPYEVPIDVAQWAVLEQGLNRHPQSEQLRGQVRRLARLTNLARGEWPQDSAVQRLLQWGLAVMPAAGPVPAQPTEPPPATGPSVSTQDGAPFASIALRGAPPRLPAADYLRGYPFRSDPQAPALLLMSALREALEADPATPWPLRREFERSRDELLPRAPLDQRRVLQRFADDAAPAPRLGRLLSLLDAHPRRQALVDLGRRLARETALLPRGEPANPLVAQLLAGLGLDAAEEARQREPATPASTVVLTVDGQHLDAAAIRERSRAARD